MTVFIRHFLLLVIAAVNLAPRTVMADSAFTARNGAPSADAMLDSGNAGIDGLAFMRPVLSGVLYRAGFKGGDRRHVGLSAAQRDALCRAGFSSAWYIDFGSRTRFGTSSCAGNELAYHKATSVKTRPVMQALHRVIDDPEQGPVLVHCMWGVHSSGIVAAMALMQFCDWSKAQARAYWHRTRNHAGCSGGCNAWFDKKLRSFRVDPGLRIDGERQRAICPRP